MGYHLRKNIRPPKVKEVNEKGEIKEAKAKKQSAAVSTTEQTPLINASSE